MSAPAAKPLRAYTVHDGDDGWTTVFASSGIAARRLGAGELNCEFEEVDSCRRSPQFDEFAPGPVPSHALIDGGWRFECSRCRESVCDLTAERTYVDEHVYCSRECVARDEADERDEAAYEAAAVELLEARYPGATLLHFERVDRDFRVPMSLMFSFPGGKQFATWTSGEETALVDQDDVETFVNLYRKSKQ
jgi:hypothetical protein